MKRILLLTIFVLVFCFDSFGQDCPTIKVIPPSKLPPENGAMLFSVSILGSIDTSKLEFKWSVSQGSIFDGQGTTAILVETNKKIRGEVIATVQIRGLPKGCQDSFSESWEIIPLPIGEPLDKLGKMSGQNESVRLNSFVIHFLRYSPQTQAYIIFSIEKDSEVDLALARQKRILKLLTQSKIPISRIRMVIESGNYYQTTIWIVPEGAKLPES